MIFPLEIKVVIILGSYCVLQEATEWGGLSDDTTNTEVSVTAGVA
jgi:hypothetical protein